MLKFKDISCSHIPISWSEKDLLLTTAGGWNGVSGTMLLKPPSVFRRSGLFLLVATLFYLGLPGPTIASAEPIALEPESTMQRRLAAGETHSYRLVVPADGVWRVLVEQLGIDVELAMTLDDGARLVVDSPLDRAGSESLLIQTEAAVGALLEVHARERAAPPASYRIVLASLADGTTQDRLRLDAEEARMEAARLYAQGADGRAASLEAYRQAADHWRAVGDDRQETRDLYCAAVLQRLLGDTRPALESSRDLLPRWQRLADRRWQAATLNEVGLLLWSLDESQEARRHFEQARDLRRTLGDDFGVAKAGSNICLTYLTEGRLGEGLSCYGPLLSTLDRHAEPQLAANVLTNIGWTNDNLGEPDAALDAYRQALALRRVAGDLHGTARTLNNLALLHQRSGELEEALASFEQALSLARQEQDLRWQAQVLLNLGSLDAILGERQRALVFLKEALDLFRKLEDRRREVWALTNLGLVHRRLGEPEVAMSHHRQALTLAQEIGDPRLEAMAETSIGLANLEMGKARPALDHGSRALQLLQGEDNRTAEAGAHQLMGRALLLAGNAQGAVPRLQEALALLREIRSRTAEAGPLTALARAERDLGHLDRARSHIEAALRSTERLRAQVDTADLRALFQSSRREAYELYIDLLMTLHRRDSDAGYDLQALAASELSRSRSLLDLLYEAGVEVGRDVGPKLMERHRSAGRKLNAKALRQSTVLAGEPTPEARRRAERELASALYELDRTEAEIRRRSPRYAALTQPQTLDAEAIQGLLDAETVLLEYTLGQKRSFLWLVTSTQIRSFELPPGRTIEEAARRFHELLSTPGTEDRAEQGAVASTLSEMLLAPLTEVLHGGPLDGEPHDIERLVVVADGALHYLPFAALPMPSDGSTPLLAELEVVSLPSASVLAQQRRRLAGRRAPEGRLALVADPVFELRDSRLRGISMDEAAAPDNDAAEGLRQASSVGWKRLYGSRQEAAAILAEAPPGAHLVAMGFDASTETVLADDFGHHRVVHFATHGVLDTDVPRLSGLVLSFYDRAGRPRQGYLRAHDVFRLDLEADLVVLSGCRTALGREVRGEGLLGLTRGFMYAGAPRVVASLWQVEDRATAELMSRFYRSMWADGASPAAALRSAQLSMLGERKWRDAYYWSSFTMQGDWHAMQEPPIGGKPLNKE